MSKHKRTYVVSKDKAGYWYAHKAGFSWIPVIGTVSKSKRKAQAGAAACMGLTLEEYLKYTQ